MPSVYEEVAARPNETLLSVTWSTTSGTPSYLLLHALITKCPLLTLNKLIDGKIP